MDNSDNAFRRVVSDNEEESSTTRVFGQTMVPSENSESVTETSENTKRKAIQSILRDKSLPELQRRKRIQALMDGSSSSSSSVNSSTAPHGSSSSVSSLSARNVASITKRGPGMATHESMASSIMSASVTSSLRVVENSLAAEFVMMNAPQHHILLWIDLKSGKFIVRFAALGKQSQMNASTATYNLVNITATFVTYG
eukprot:CAMPEP_0184867346 /NCGR_PEP_ID=MMETSP0580-20130426/26144_1 /TAXON_ID=1118495 /ORGANISM="Dactyliosolen fragilissimus" /LENGTH=197 /DNA_ID=CAMNT_0027367573 /DNA_START=149 /DNA_END=743 /DNA_ORIENTATION=-